VDKKLKLNNEQDNKTESLKNKIYNNETLEVEEDTDKMVT